MKFASVILILGAAAGCSSAPSGTPGAAPPSAARPASRPEGVVILGDPDAGSLSTCDDAGRWKVNGATVEHWIFQTDDKREFTTADGARSFGLFRGNVPFPYFVWQPSDFQVNQLVYPSGGGFVAMYHVMNHGNEARSCRLFIGFGAEAGARRDGRTLSVAGRNVVVGSEDPVASAEGSRGRTALAYDLDVQPGSSRFVFLTTPELAGKVTPELLDAAAARWDQRLASRRLTLPDPQAMTQYYADLAGAILGVAGCRERAALLEARIVRPEGDALRLLADVPAPWLDEGLEATGLPTAHGPLSFRYQGAFFNRAIDLDGSCRPPGGFLVEVPPKLKAKIDGAAAETKDGLLRVPAGSRRVELSLRE